MGHYFRRFTSDFYPSIIFNKKAQPMNASNQKTIKDRNREEWIVGNLGY